MEQPGGKEGADRCIFNRRPVRNEPGSRFRAPTFQRKEAKDAKAAERQNSRLSAWRLRELCPLALTGEGAAVQSPVCFIMSREQARHESCADCCIFNLGLNRLVHSAEAGVQTKVSAPTRSRRSTPATGPWPSDQQCRRLRLHPQAIRQRERPQGQLRPGNGASAI